MIKKTLIGHDFRKIPQYRTTAEAPISAFLKPPCIKTSLDGEPHKDTLDNSNLRVQLNKIEILLIHQMQLKIYIFILHRQPTLKQRQQIH